MIILGINAYHGDVSAVVLRDGELVAAVCAIDGFGDFVSTSWAIGRGHSMELLERVYFLHSLGLVYLALTQYLGFPKCGDEYKVMGLAPYGEPDFVTPLRQLIHLKPDGGFELDLSYFRHHWDSARRRAVLQPVSPGCRGVREMFAQHYGAFSCGTISRSTWSREGCSAARIPDALCLWWGNVGRCLAAGSLALS